MSFGAIRDQDTALRLMRRVLQNDRIPNAMLFWGPGGVGKTTSALEMAKAVNCAEQADDACDACLSCRKILHGNHPDVKTVIPAKTSRVIDKEVLEEHLELAYLRPHESRYRVFILQDADRLTLRAQTYFLKTLEEPPGRALFLLVSEHPRVLLDTIRSRCQMVRFRTLRTETIVEWLQRERDLPEELARSVAALSQGQMSRALDLIESERRDVALELTRRLGQREDPVALAEEFSKFLDGQRKQIEENVKAELGLDKESESRDELERMKEERMAQLQARVKREILEYLYLLETWYRDEMVYRATGNAGAVMNGDQLERLKAGTSADAPAKIAAIEKARSYLDKFINEERVFRDLFFALAVP